jgi:hypothetical protein
MASFVIPPNLLEQASESFLLEMMIGRERFGNGLFLHLEKADGVAEGIRLVQAAGEHDQGCAVRRLVNPPHLEQRMIQKIAHELKSDWPGELARIGQSGQFGQNVVVGDQAIGAAVEPDCFCVEGIADVVEAKQAGGVEEPISLAPLALALFPGQVRVDLLVVGGRRVAAVPGAQVAFEGGFAPLEFGGIDRSSGPAVSGQMLGDNILEAAALGGGLPLQRLAKLFRQLVG